MATEIVLKVGSVDELFQVLDQLAAKKPDAESAAAEAAEASAGAPPPPPPAQPAQGGATA